MNRPDQFEQLTASGRGAVAVVSIHTADASVLDNYFHAANGMLAASTPIGRILFGHWRDEEIVVVRVADSSWEINCHGGEAAVRQIQADLSSQIPPSSRPEGQSLSDKLTDLLLRCRSRRVAEILLSQQQGVLRQFLESLCRAQSVSTAEQLVGGFLRWQNFARHLVIPWNITIAGLPNAGKSSLLNALIGYQRAIVFDQPGTTRDRIEAELMLGGWAMNVTDTAGIRNTSDEIENMGVQAAFNSLDSCDLCLLVVDSTSGWSKQDTEILSTVAADASVAVLFNKSDLCGGESQQLPSLDHQLKTFHVSATTGAGLNELLGWIPSLLVAEVPDLNQPLPVISEISTALEAFRRKHPANAYDLSLLRATLQTWL